MAEDTIRIVLVDDHIKVHHAIADAIDHWDDIVVVGQGSNGQEAIQLCEEHHPDIILMDVLMPVMDGIEATQIISERFPYVKVLVLSSFQDDDSIQAMLQAGAIGYLLKNSSIDDLAHTIRTANSGTSVFSAEVTQTLLQPAQTAPKRDYSLTPREVEVLKLMVKGLNNRQIGETLVISQSTAKFHVSSILTKLDVSSRIEAVALAVEHNLVSGSA
jgi:NarL family two-component system response regulator LiaR